MLFEVRVRAAHKLSGVQREAEESQYPARLSVSTLRSSSETANEYAAVLILYRAMSSIFTGQGMYATSISCPFCRAGHLEWALPSTASQFAPELPSQRPIG